MALLIATTLLALHASPGYGEPGVEVPPEAPPTAPAAPDAPLTTTTTTTTTTTEGTTVDAPAGETVIVIPAATDASQSAPQPTIMPIVDPLPPPPASLPRSSIRRGTWRGRYWFSLQLGVSGPLGGARPAKPTATSLVGGLDLGWRARNWLGLGFGISDQVHDSESVKVNTPTGQETQIRYGHMFYWDVLFARLFLPTKRRFQPYVDIGGALASYSRPTDGVLLGGALRSGLGFDAWVTPFITIGANAQYRYTRLEQKFADGSEKHPQGHSYRVLFELGFHW